MPGGGAFNASFTFDAYGKTLAHTGSASFQYAGQCTDAETGLQYLRARYYDSATAQFLSRDPAVAATRSPYGYVGGNPLNATDPSGLCWGPDWVCNAVGAVASGARSVVHEGLELAESPIYATYYGAYRTDSSIN